MTQSTTKQAQNQAQAQAKQTAEAATASIDAATTAAFDVPSALRDFAEQTTSRAKQNYDAYKTFAEDATDAMEDAITTVNKGTGELQRQALVSAKAQLNAGFDFAEKMLNVKSFSEAVELQTGFMRQQFETMQSNVRQFQELSTRLQQETTKPFTSNVAKAMEHWRVGA